MSPEFEKFLMNIITKVLKFLKWYFIIVFGIIGIYFLMMFLIPLVAMYFN